VITQSEVKRWGNSIGIIIPKEIAKAEGISAGDRISIEITKCKPLSGFGIWKGRSLPKFERDHDDHEEF
jgi:bifunctional DNA-binding transcriptional regulator/antitoxin component of YhaV-PrlF toxin-antitoxin module